ncbi:MAG: carbohydrate kinase family protein [Candidatus Komeilibacteria bacterium]|nr:carbohydrate kinase family protein [Candidatus Komeilibacteria bacterium]
MSILVSGSVVYDRIMDFPGAFSDHILPDQIHNLNVSFLVKEFKETFGGVAANIAYNLALLNERPQIYSAVGKDFSPYALRLKKYKIDLSGVKVYPGQYTSSAYIMTDKNDNQITGFFPGAMNFFGARPKLKKGDIAIVAPGNKDEMLALADYYFKNKIFFIFDPGQQIGQFNKQQLTKALTSCNIYIVNDYELALTQKITGLNKQELLKKSVVLITTLGAKGSSIEIYHNNQFKAFSVKAVKPNKVVDPTGAGDAYRAGIIKGLLMTKAIGHANLFDWEWLKIGQLGSLSAKYAVEQYGTQNHSYSYNQFKKDYNFNFNQIIN